MRSTTHLPRWRLFVLKNCPKLKVVALTNAQRTIEPKVNGVYLVSHLIDGANFRAMVTGNVHACQISVEAVLIDSQPLNARADIHLRAMARGQSVSTQPVMFVQHLRCHIHAFGNWASI